MKIKLSITSDYCPDWASKEGVRELLQNWLDARTPDCSIEHDPSNNVLVLRNVGQTITPADVGLIGKTSKAGDASARGQFGEGLKIGILALVRSGHGVRIDSGNDTYSAALEHADEFDDEVLCFTKSPTGHHKSGVEVRVTAVTETMWRTFRQDFLDLRDPAPRVHPTPSGEVLLDPEEKGRVYVKGIFVRHYDDLTHGYNFTGPKVKVDRDRRLVDDVDLGWEVSRMHSQMLKDGQITPEAYLEDLESGSTTTRFASSHLDKDQKQQVADAWDKKYDTKVPGDDVPTTYAAREVLADHREKKLAQRRGKVVRDVEYNDLTHEEQTTSNAVDFLLEQTETFIPLRYAEFEDPATRHANGIIARSALESPKKLLRVAVDSLPQTDPVETLVNIIASLKGWEK